MVKLIRLVPLIVLAAIRMGSCCYGKQMLRSGGLNCQDKQLIVDMHNRLRQSVATGRIAGQPTASNMLEMVWDDELARKAQTWADKCVGNHDSSTSRRVGYTIVAARFAVGQNLATAWTSPRPNSWGAIPDFASQIKAWFNEVYQYRGSYSSGTGHYSQMVWGDTYLVGCGYSYYFESSQSKYTKLYICNYGPQGNIIGYFPYSTGHPSCSLFGSTPSRKYNGLCTVRGYYGSPCYYG